MKVTVKRGELRRVLSQLQPHMGQLGKENPDAQPYGRVRVAVSNEDRLVMWAGDSRTRACASLEIIEYYEAELPIFDLSVEDVATLLKTFKPAGDSDQRSMWLDGLFELRIVDERLFVTELHSFEVEGRSLALPLAFKPNMPTDTYPDFPASIISVLAAPLEPIIAAYPDRESLFRVLSAVHPLGALQILESSRNALIVTGTPEFTAIVPCRVDRPMASREQSTPDSFQDTISMLLPYVQPIDESTESGKIRAAITRGLERATHTGDDK